MALSALPILVSKPFKTRHCPRRLARVIDGRKESEDQAANREEMQKRLPQEPLE